MVNNSDLDKSILKGAKSITPDLGKSEPKPDSVLNPEQAAALEHELDLERKYGDATARTFLEGAASGASFGLSDQALVKFGGEEMKEALRERRQRNTAAATTGELAGVIGATLGTGGTSAVPRLLSSGVRGAAKAGQIAEAAAAKLLQSSVAQSTNKTIAQNIIRKTIAKGSGSAVEGSLYGTGHLISENALGTAEFNGENLVAAAGTGALLGGAFGSVLGSMEAIAPVIKAGKAVDYVKTKISTNFSRPKAADKLLGRTTREVEKQLNNPWGAQINENTPKFLTENLNLRAFDSTDKLYKASKKEIERIGNEISVVVDKVDNLAKKTNLDLLPTRSQVATKVQQSLDEIGASFKGIPDESAKKILSAIDKRKASWDEWLVSAQRISAVDLKQLKTQLQQSTKWTRSFDSIPVQGKMDRSVAEAVRREFLDLADRVSPVDNQLGVQLRSLNLDYGTAIDVTEKLSRKLKDTKPVNFFKFKDMLVAGVATQASGIGAAGLAVGAKRLAESDLIRKVNLLVSIEKANTKISNKISSGVNDFFKDLKKTTVPASTRVLMDTQFTVPKDDGTTGKKPKNRQEAFKKASDSIINLVEDQKKLANHLATNSLMNTDAAPATAVAMSETLTKAVNFLYSKLPKSNNITGGGAAMFQREYVPSSIEVAKFERYAAAVNDPSSVLEDLRDGRITRESVEALSAVYPDIYRRLQSEVMEKVTANPQLSYQKRLQLGVLLNIDSDFSLVPLNIDGLQQTFRMQQQAQTAAISPAVNTTQGGLEKLSFSKDRQTEMQRIGSKDT